MLPFHYPHFFTTFKLPKFFNQFQIPFLSSLVAKTLFKFSQNIKSLFISTNSPTGHVKIIISLFTSSLERKNKMWTIHLNSHRQVSDQLIYNLKIQFCSYCETFRRFSENQLSANSCLVINLTVISIYYIIQTQFQYDNQVWR